MMKDLPGQTEEIHRLDMDILRDMGFSTRNSYRSYQLSSCAPFPGTKMYEDLVKDKNTNLQDYSRYDGGQNTLMNEVNK